MRSMSTRPCWRAMRDMWSLERRCEIIRRPDDSVPGCYLTNTVITWCLSLLLASWLRVAIFSLHDSIGSAADYWVSLTFWDIDGTKRIQIRSDFNVSHVWTLLFNFSFLCRKTRKLYEESRGPSTDCWILIMELSLLHIRSVSCKCKYRGCWKETW